MLHLQSIFVTNFNFISHIQIHVLITTYFLYIYNWQKPQYNDYILFSTMKYCSVKLWKTKVVTESGAA